MKNKGQTSLKSFFGANSQKQKQSEKPKQPVQAKTQEKKVEFTTEQNQNSDVTVVSQQQVKNRIGDKVKGKQLLKKLEATKDVFDNQLYSQSNQQTVIPQSQYTPLELQVVDFKKKYPGVVLMIEVGYKMRFFGEDARIASEICGIYCHPDHNFLTASFPVPKTSVYIQRLVQQGHKVGVIKQIETAAIKAQSDNKNKPFTRKLVGMYTIATVEAAQKLDECISEIPNKILITPMNYRQSSQGLPKKKSSVSQLHSGSLGLIAVDTSTGDTVYLESQAPTAKQSIEKILLSYAPSEIVVSSRIPKACWEAIRSFKQLHSDCRLQNNEDSNTGFPSVNNIVGYLVDYYQIKKDTYRRRQDNESHPEKLLLQEKNQSQDQSSVVDMSIDIVENGETQVQKSNNQYNDQQYPSNSNSVGFKNSANFESSKTNNRSGQKQNNVVQNGQVQVLSSQDDDVQFCSDELNNLQAMFKEELQKEMQDQLKKRQDMVEKVLELPLSVLWALYSAIQHLKEFNLDGIFRFSLVFRKYDDQGQMRIPPNSLAQLEVFQILSDNASYRLSSQNEGSLFRVLNYTKTQFGTNLLRQWLSHPLKNRDSILERQKGVIELKGCEYHIQLHEFLNQIPNLQKIITRIVHKTVSPPEFVQAIRTFSYLPESLHFLPAPKEVDSSLLSTLYQQITNHSVCQAARDVLSIINVKAAQQNDMVNIIQDTSTYPDLASTRRQVAEAKQKLEDLLPVLAKQIGMHDLQYSTIQNTGEYLVEVPNTGFKVPHDWNLVNQTKKVRRYHPPSVVQGIEQLAYSKEVLQKEAYLAWYNLLDRVCEVQPLMGAVVQGIGVLDTLQSLATYAETAQCCQPQFLDENEGQKIVLEGLVHPVLQQVLQQGAVPNNVKMTDNEGKAIILTGPNMGGKSSTIRSIALCSLMAQIGSLIPCKKAVLPIIDGIYTRMGATDNIMQGRSTFLEELSDANEILQNCTPRSLVIIDELGRGTSTHDGVAIALSTLEQLIKIGCFTLFVTHYPELDILTAQYPQIVKSFHMSFLRRKVTHSSQAINERKQQELSVSSLSNQEYLNDIQNNPSTQYHQIDDEIVFLYQLTPGIMDKSFGLNVAHMAQIPRSVVLQAKIKAQQFEAQTKKRKKRDSSSQQLSISDSDLVSRDNILVYNQSQSQDLDVNAVKLKKLCVLFKQNNFSAIREVFSHQT